MKWPIRFTLTAAALSVMFLLDFSMAEAQQKRLTADQAEVVSAVSAIFEAAAHDDLAKFHALVAPGFYLYDAGTRIDGDKIMALIKAEHAKGRRYEWKVTEPDVHVFGDTAWIAYVNQGSITDQSGTVPVKWLESGFLQRQGGVWKIDFMHSTRSAASPPSSSLPALHDSPTPPA